MEFYNQNWFWTGLFTIVGTLGGLFFKEISNFTRSMKIEKIKIYDEKQFSSYNELYSFISTAQSLCLPPGDIESDFAQMMKRSFYTKIKCNYLYYTPSIRSHLKTLESRHICLCDDELMPKVPHDIFFDKEYMKILEDIEHRIEAKYNKHF